MFPPEMGDSGGSTELFLRRQLGVVLSKQRSLISEDVGETRRREFLARPPPRALESGCWAVPAPVGARASAERPVTSQPSGTAPRGRCVGLAGLFSGEGRSGGLTSI